MRNSQSFHFVKVELRTVQPCALGSCNSQNPGEIFISHVMFYCFFGFVSGYYCFFQLEGYSWVT